MFMVVGQEFSEVSEHGENNFVIVEIKDDIEYASPKYGDKVDWKKRIHFSKNELIKGNTFCSYLFGSKEKLIFPTEDN